MIAGLAGPDGHERHARVTRFLELYHDPLAAFLRWRFPGLSREMREDFLQGFVADRLLAKTLYERALGAQRSFRPYLRQSLSNYCIDQLRRRKLPVVGLDAVAHGVAAAGGGDPFDYAWAQTVIEEAIRRMRSECARADRALVWEVFNVRVRRPAYRGEAAVSFKELAERHGRTERQMRNLLVTGKRMVHRHLVEIVRGYTASEAQAASEIRDLQAIVARGLPAGGAS